MENIIRKFLIFINARQPGDLKLPDRLVDDFLEEIDKAIKEDDIMDLRSKLGSIYTEHIQKLQEESKSVIK